jgi:hypothetical protein
MCNRLNTARIHIKLKLKVILLVVDSNVQYIDLEENFKNARTQLEDQKRHID